MADTRDPHKQPPDQIQAAIDALEAQRGVLGDEVVETALAPLKGQLARLSDPDGSGDSGERKLATILFADISGFTAMSDGGDPEQLSDLINRLWRQIDKQIESNQGRIDKHMGDAVMAVWSTDAEHDPVRAVRTGLALQGVLTAFRSESGTELTMRVGINTGLCHLGSVGNTAEYTAMGDAVNLASRLEHEAPLGGVLISQATYRQIRGMFDVTPEKPRRIRGVKQPVRTFVVDKEKPFSFRSGHRGVEGVDTPLVGRDRELNVIHSGFAQGGRMGIYRQ